MAFGFEIIRIIPTTLLKLSKEAKRRGDKTLPRFLQYVNAVHLPVMQDDEGKPYILWDDNDPDKIYIDCDYEHRVVTLTRRNCIVFEHCSIEDLVGYYRTINYVNYSRRRRLYYFLSDDNTLSISCSVSFPLYDQELRQHCWNNIRCIIDIPESFKEIMEKEKMNVAEGDICCLYEDIPKLQNPIIVEAPNKKFVKDFLDKIHANPREKEDDTNFLFFTFQGNQFTIDINPDNNELILDNNGWYDVEMMDIDRLSELRKVINRINQTTYWHLSYKRDVEERIYTVFAQAIFIRSDSIQEFEQFMEYLLVDFFKVREQLYREFYLYDRKLDVFQTVENSTKQEDDADSNPKENKVEELLLEVMKETDVKIVRDYECGLYFPLEDDGDSRIWIGSNKASDSLYLNEYSVWEISRWNVQAKEGLYDTLNNLNSKLYSQLSAKYEDDDYIHIDCSALIPFKTGMSHLREHFLLHLNEMKAVNGLFTEVNNDTLIRMMNNGKEESGHLYEYDDIDVTHTLLEAVKTIDPFIRVAEDNVDGSKRYALNYHGTCFIVNQRGNDIRIELKDIAWYSFDKMNIGMYNWVMDKIGDYYFKVVCESRGSNYVLTTIVHIPCLDEQCFMEDFRKTLNAWILTKRKLIKEFDYLEYIQKKNDR